MMAFAVVYRECDSYDRILNRNKLAVPVIRFDSPSISGRHDLGLTNAIKLVTPVDEVIRVALHANVRCGVAKLF